MGSGIGVVCHFADVEVPEFEDESLVCFGDKDVGQLQVAVKYFEIMQGLDSGAHVNQGCPDLVFLDCTSLLAFLEELGHVARGRQFRDDA